MLRKAAAGHLNVTGHFRISWVVALLAIGSVVCVAAAPPPSEEDEQLFGRMVSAVERHYERAQTLVATETTTIQQLNRWMRNEGAARTVISEVRFEWGGSNVSPRTIRQLVNAEGPRLSDTPCYEPESESHDWLAILLPPRRNLRLKIWGTDPIAGVRAKRIEFDLITRNAPRAEWKDNCGRVQAGISTRGSIWVHPATGEVLRFTKRLVDDVTVPGQPGPDGRALREYTVRRADTTIDFVRYAFTDPDETLLLPSRHDSVLVVTNASVPRMRTTLTFTNYRRYLTSGRVVPE